MVDNLAAVSLAPETAGFYPIYLSDGMQKRLGLPCAIANDPEILFLDERMARLDPIMCNNNKELILDVVQEIGATVISINSDMVGAHTISKRVPMIHEGRVICHSATERVEVSDNPYVD